MYGTCETEGGARSSVLACDVNSVSLVRPKRLGVCTKHGIYGTCEAEGCARSSALACDINSVSPEAK